MIKIYEDLHTIIAALSKIAGTGKQPKWPSKEQRIKKWHIGTKE